MNGLDSPMCLMLKFQPQTYLLCVSVSGLDRTSGTNVAMNLLFMAPKLLIIASAVNKIIPPRILSDTGKVGFTYSVKFP